MTTDILQHSPPQLHHPSPPSSISSTHNDGLHSRAIFDRDSFISAVAPVALCRRDFSSGGQDQDHLSVLAAFLTAFRKSFVGCRDASAETCAVEEQLMEIGCPTDVRHVAHVTFDRFNGFLGLPVEFEPEVPRRPPSASTTVFGVSTESMQLSYDSRGNCVPTILLMMQRRLYSQGGLQSEGIFRINPENGQEEYVREQLNNGLIPDNIDVHCLAGLIKAWFRELPSGVLDSLPPEQIMEAQTEDECTKLVRHLPPTEAALLDWAINLMADVAQFEHSNKMNARNIAMVFAPNMTQMSDPLTALMHAVQVMNFLKTLIVRTMRERDHLVEAAGPALHLEPSDEEDGRQGISKPINPEEASEEEHEVGQNQTISSTSHAGSRTSNDTLAPANSVETNLPDQIGDNPDTSNPAGARKDKDGLNSTARIRRNQARSRRTKLSQHRNPNDVKKGSRKLPTETVEKKELNIVSRVNSRSERVEAWR